MPSVDWRVPDGIEPLVAYRLWRVTHERLCSIAHITLWEPGRIDAMCMVAPHPAPMEGCTCGLYAFKRLEDATWVFSTPIFSHAVELSPHGSVIVAGTVALWGKVIEAERGYRAQFGRVTGLFPRGSRLESDRRLARRYGVPISAWPQTAAGAWMAGRVRARTPNVSEPRPALGARVEAPAAQPPDR